MKVKANELKIGTVLKSGELVKSAVRCGFRGPKKIAVVLEKNGKIRSTQFNANSTIFVESA